MQIIKNIKNIFKQRRQSYTIGKCSKVLEPSYIDKNCKIGKYTYIGKFACITKATVGNYCSIGDFVTVGPGEHCLDRVSTSHFFAPKSNYEELTAKDCTIENDVWIGCNSIIRRGVCIGNGAVIGANSFVNKDVPPYAVVGGVPAKIIRYRFEDEKQQQILQSKWWEKDLDEAKNIVCRLQSDKE